jgi:stage II sporulation protein M
LIILAAIFGYFFPVFFVDYIKKFFEEILKETEGFSTIQMIFFILYRNLTSSFYSLTLGIAFGVFPIIALLFNGYIVGFVIKKASVVYGSSVVWNLVPHGIFEFPAIILSMGLGIRMGSFLFVKNKKERFWHDLENSLRVFIFVILPLLILAAIIEGLLVGA